ncbi:MAG: site-specific DNA-methyltransferase [Luteibacter sp.]
MIFAGRRFAHRCIVAMEDSGFVLRDMLAWERPTAVHRAQRLSVVFDRRGDTESAEKWDGWRLGNLRPTFEPVIWCMKPYKQGKTIADNVLAYGLGAYNEAAFIRAEGEPENIIRSGFGPNERGHHPTQKPLALMKSLIELVTTEDHVVLDPFCGSGTTLVAAKLLGRKYVGFEIDDAHYQAAVGRLDELKGGLF